MVGDRRFERRATPISGTKLCGRREVNPELSVEESFDEELFRGLLEDVFGSVEEQDYGFTISIIDTETQTKFKAYSGPSGPAYGGKPSHFETTSSGGYRLKPTTRSVLEEFEKWLTSEGDNGERRTA